MGELDRVIEKRRRRALKKIMSKVYSKLININIRHDMLFQYKEGYKLGDEYRWPPKKSNRSTDPCPAVLLYCADYKFSSGEGKYSKDEGSYPTNLALFSIFFPVTIWTQDSAAVSKSNYQFPEF